MTKPNQPSDPQDREERAIRAALGVLESRDPDRGLAEALGPGAGPEAPGREAEAAEAAEAEVTLRRLYVETLGLLAWAAPAEAPPEQVKDRLMATIGEGRPAASGGRPRPGTVVPISGGPQVAEVSSPAARHQPKPAPRRRSWFAALAAAFAAGALGLAGWLYVELDRTQDALARLADERVRLEEQIARQEEMVTASGDRSELVAAMATAGLKVCPLRPVEGVAPDRDAFAILYMPPGSQEWYLLASNLKARRGVYKVWLNTRDGAMPLGLLEPGSGSALEFAAPAMDGGRPPMLSIVVTLEPSPDIPDPSGPPVLFGDEMLTIL